ncbi:oligosaccharide flippase family protein [Salinivibrio costicola]|uniref:Oligosaccharide flippase family protein n=1 Tax=Salinivibrio costicola TaxID=51367 RepID=A0ABX6K4L8_SALCS|nr:oligosaccharide flippase family protein [Salinivibrio costicola]QIR06487.1 oligosaccharide flippase family protein [Salinivibrio costicola]
MSNKKELVKNLISFGAIDLLGLLIPIITMPILTRALGPSQYGELLLLLTMLYFGHTIIDYGTQFTAVRKLARARGQNNSVNSIYSDTQSLRIILCALYLTGISLYCLFLSLDNMLNYVLAAGSFYLIGYTLTSAWFFQGIGSVEQLMKVSLTAKSINLIVIVFFVSEPKDLNIAIAATCLPMFFSGIFLAAYAHQRYKLSLPKFNNLSISLREGGNVFLGLLAPNLYNAIPTIALGTIFPASEFANFAIASRLASVIVTIQEVLAKSVYPILARVKESQVNKLLLANGLVSLVPIIVLYFLGEWILNTFLGRGFEGVNKYLVIFSIGVLFIGLSNAFSKGYFLPNGLDNVYRDVSLRISLISAILCACSIYQFGLLGAAISILLARFLFFADYLIAYRRLIKRQRRVFKPIFKSSEKEK